MVTRGPSLYALSAFAGASVPAGGAVGPVRFFWPRDQRVTGLLVVPRTGAVGDAAALSVVVQDEDAAELVTDGVGFTDEAPALALSGPSFRPFPLDRLVRSGDPWTFTVRNASGAPIVLAGLFLYFDEVGRALAS